MDDTDFEHDDDQQQQQDRMVQMSRKDIRALEKKAQAAADAESRALDAERRLAFSDAGFSSKDPLHRLFRDAYRGEDLSDEALRKAAAEYGIPGFTSEADDEAQAAQQDARAHDRVTSTVVGAPAPGKVEPAAAAVQAKTPQEYMALYAGAGGRVEEGR